MCDPTSAPLLGHSGVVCDSFGAPPLYLPTPSGDEPSSPKDDALRVGGWVGVGGVGGRPRPESEMGVAAHEVAAHVFEAMAMHSLRAV